MKSLLEKLQESEKNTPENNSKKQYKLLKRLVKHAASTTEFYKYYNPELSFNALPVLSRATLQMAYEQIVSSNIPVAHGETYTLTTSGSTGQVVRLLGTAFTRLFYDALMLREHQWHQRDLTQKLLAIRWLDLEIAQPPIGQYQTSWGPPINLYQPTGPSVLINISSATHLQVEALIHHKPYYLTTYPSQLAVLASYCLAHHITLPDLHEVRTIGEMLTQKQIQRVKSIWPHVKITDIYSCIEIGNVASQCPEYKQYHVNIEHVYLEIVDEQNQPCAIGEPGKVLVTSLMNYATPLIRYELGDYAAWGEPCQCGRTLPVLKHILGRKRNRLILPNGESRFPYVGEHEDFSKIAPIRIQKFQFIQRALDEIEIKAVTPDRLTIEQTAAAKAFYKKIFGAHFKIIISFPDEISSGPTGKFEEFISLVDEPLKV
jgi:phenylacetate-CoA ligase